MMSLKVKRETKNFEKWISKIAQLKKASVESGYFPQQGDHPTADMSYVELAELHAKGAGDLPKRDIRPAVTHNMKFGSSFSRSNKHMLVRYLIGKLSIDNYLSSVGHKISDSAQSYFGIPSGHNPSNSEYWADFKGADTPLVFDGYLRDAWSYKTSTSPSIRGV